MKALIIFNPKAKAGSNKKIEPILKKKFANFDAEFAKTAYPGHATILARRAAKERFDTVVAVGGDGTIHEVLNGIVGSTVVLGIIPRGTANDLASYYSLPGNVEKACEIILQRRVHCADVIQVNNRYFITAGGMGFPSDVAIIANTIKSRNRAGRFLRNILASKLYILASLWAILKAKHQNFLKVRWNGTSSSLNTLSLTINNQPFLGKNFLISPGATNDDGKLDVCWIKNSKTRVGILSILLRVLSGRHGDSPAVKMWRTDALTVEADHPLPFLSDGEVLPKSKEFRIHIIPHALKVIVPKIWGIKPQELTC